ncbi:MAG: 5-bromo-4-chloroindolyl phosphate hydrolysis family protein [Oscillospiraceae bacterium]|nr:5-bromo-4-chloroindolyl phosphate hydrolysis family protein [Oscillospiraceae bacterium]
MLEIKKKSAVPVYGAGAVFVLYCLIFPLYRTWHFIILAVAAVLCYVLLSMKFTGTTEFVEIPEEPTGNAEVDALLDNSKQTITELNALREKVPGVRQKLDEIIDVTEMVFKKLHSTPSVYRDVKRFADFYLPTTIKLLRTYESFSTKSVRGEHIEETLRGIDSALDSVLASYQKLYDSLYKNVALDIETDIIVLENLLKQEGLM